MDPQQMMMWYLMQQGMGGGQPQQQPQRPMMANPQMVPMGDQLRRSVAAQGPMPASYRGGIIPMMANGSMGTTGNDLARLADAAPQQTGPGGVVQVSDVPQGKLGWMDQFGRFLDSIDPNMRLMMGMGGLSNLGRILGGGA